MNTRPNQPVTAGSIDEWTDLIRSKFVALDIAPQTASDPQEPLNGTVWNRQLGHLSAAEVSSSPQVFTRSKRLVAAEPAELFQIGLVTQGSGHLIQDGRSCNVKVGDFAVYETARPFRWQLDGDWKLLVFTWQREAIALDRLESEQITALRLPGHSGISGILAHALTDVVNLGSDVSAASGIRFADELAALAVTAGLEQREITASTQSLTKQVLHFIELNLADPLLDPQHVADHFFISTRTLHRLFAREGETVANWIRGRRMEKSRHALLVEPKSSISTIIARYGYFDLAQFSRNFTTRYGVNPTQFRARCH
ncbi:helix-turn-helix domain-containing protein [Rhodococcus sp. OK302]|uniref:helix-turn-helix domain-containing protein n=1 Tax=Rhodococcus sp. OK302 TaxID=1882769 RepID=UPI000B942786|nr:helix-turn-helix domain-containing protein [Rhodococcus sp. OK302]OYD69566.1 AraC-like DNA-binding protein [Rhodococcus sp. OK302]